MGNQLIYDTSILYNQHMGANAQQALAAFYRDLFAGYPIRTIHDCSVGAGGTTIPLIRLGYTVSGSDLSENLLDRAKLNFEECGFTPNLFIADFRKIGEHLDEKVDCMISTGNSLPHVDLDGFNAFLQSASKALKSQGLLFFDIRNWDALAKEKPIIRAMGSKMMTADERRSLYLLLNWHDDGSVTFSFATSVDQNDRHVGMDVIQCPAYYPLLRNDIIACLKRHGYQLLNWLDMDDLWIAKDKRKTKVGDFESDFPDIQWYGVLARKIN